MFRHRNILNKERWARRLTVSRSSPAEGKVRQELPGIEFINVGYKGPDACNTRPAIFIQSSHLASRNQLIERKAED